MGKKTKRRLMDRFQGHFYNINSKNLRDTVGKHFNLANHHGIEDIEIHIIDFIHAHPNSVNASPNTQENREQLATKT